MPSSTARVAVGDSLMWSRSPSMVAIGARRLINSAGGGGRSFLAMDVAAQPLHLGPQDQHLAEDKEDAEHQHAHDHRVEDRRVVEHPEQVLVQHPADPRHHRQEQQHANQVGQGVAHAISRRGGAVTGRAPARRRVRRRRRRGWRRRRRPRCAPSRPGRSGSCARRARGPAPPCAHRWDRCRRRRRAARPGAMRCWLIVLATRSRSDLPRSLISAELVANRTLTAGATLEGGAARCSFGAGSATTGDGRRRRRGGRVTAPAQ